MPPAPPLSEKSPACISSPKQHNCPFFPEIMKDKCTKKTQIPYSFDE
jgi:hypothetical protein